MKKTITDDGEILVQEMTDDELDLAIQKGFREVFWKTPNNHNTDEVAAQTALFCKDPSRTQQSHAKEADINNILAKFMQTGELATRGQAIYQDAEQPFDLQDSIVTQHQVTEAWDSLPKEARAILKTPEKFVEYIDHCMATGDLDPLRELGLARPLPAPEASKPEPAPSSAGPEKTAPEPSKAASAA